MGPIPVSHGVRGQLLRILTLTLVSGCKGGATSRVRMMG